MSNLFGNLTTDGLEDSQDRLGGYQPLDTSIYDVKIKAAYAGKSDGGAMSVSIIGTLEGGKEYRETFWVTNKKGENFFLNKDDKSKKVPLPGFTVVDDICLIATGKPLSMQDTEEKVINLYDREAQREIPKNVQMLTGLLDQSVKLGIVKQLENKTKKNEQTNQYDPIAEDKLINFVDKVFHPELKLTVAEARDNQETAKFHDAWLDRNKDQVRDKRTIKDGQGGKTGAPPQAGGNNASQPAARTSLFGKK